MMDVSILRRLVLAKTFLLKAKDAMGRAYDENSLAVAIVMLHDATDNLLGAVASYKSTKLKKTYMRDIYDAIVSQGTSLSHDKEIAQLNTYRNNVKHQGLMPNLKDIILLLSKITDFCEQTCTNIFGLPLSKISVKEQIEDQPAKTAVEEIEKDIDEQNYKEAMLNAATAMFTYFTDKHLSTWRLTSALTDLTNVMSGKAKVSAYNTAFPNGIARDLNLDLMQIGIDPYLFYRFRNLTPDIGYTDYQTKKLIYKKDASTWHEGNWTEENALFCLNFLIEALVSQQRQYNGYTIKTRDVSHKIQFLHDARIFDYLQKPALSFKKGAQLEGKLLSYAGGAIQPSRHTERGYTDIMIEIDGKHDIFLLQPGDFTVLEEKSKTTNGWY